MEMEKLESPTESDGLDDYCNYERDHVKIEGFSNLSAELIIQIMVDLPDIKSLRNLVLAGPLIATVYYANQKSILISRIEKGLAPDKVNIQIAMSACKATDLDISAFDRMEQISRFLEDTIENHPSNEETLRDLSVARCKQMLTLHRDALLIADHAAQRLLSLCPFAEPRRDSSERPLSLCWFARPRRDFSERPLSSTELSRLVKGICQWELYSSVFIRKPKGLRSIDDDGRDWPTGLGQLYIGGLLPHEQHSLGSIYNYAARECISWFDETADLYRKGRNQNERSQICEVMDQCKAFRRFCRNSRYHSSKTSNMVIDL